MKPLSALPLCLALLAAPALPAQPPATARAFEIGTNNLYEALRQLAAYRRLDLVVDPEVPNVRSMYVFKHTTWEKALEALLASQGLGCEIRDRILHVGPPSRFPGSAPATVAERETVRAVAFTCKVGAEGELLLSVSASEATREELLASLARVERMARTKPGPRTFSARWVFRAPRPADAETFSMEDISPEGLKALYP